MMDAVDDDAHVLDRFALHFGHGGFDLPSETSDSSTGLHHHQTPSSENDFVEGAMASDSLNLDHHRAYYSDPNLAASSILDVSNSVMYDSAFASVNLGDADSVSRLLENGSSQLTTSSVVDAVASGAIDSSMNESRLYEADHHLSSSTSPSDDKKSCTCKDCGKVFNSVWYLKQHAVKHSSERPFKCKYCHKTYRFRSNLYQHKCPLRDRASELATAAICNGKLGGDGSRKRSSSTTTDSPHPSSESSSSAAEVAAAIASAGAVRPRKRRAWPPLTSPPTSTTPSTVNGGEKHYKGKMRKGNQFGGESSMAANAPLKWDVNSRCGAVAGSISSSADSPTSPSLMHQTNAATKRVALLSEEEVQKFLDRHKDKLHKCPKCKSLWPSREYLTRHMEWHNDDSSRFRCVHCSETFVDEHRYGLHKQNHSPSSLHVCARCRGKFCTRVALKKHARRCALADTKSQNGSIGGGQIVKAVNGYRQALFIDPTPPPSPRPPTADAIENGSTEGSHRETTNSESGENEDGGGGGDSAQLALASQRIVSPSSSSSEDGGGAKADSVMRASSIGSADGFGGMNSRVGEGIEVASNIPFGVGSNDTSISFKSDAILSAVVLSPLEETFGNCGKWSSSFESGGGVPLSNVPENNLLLAADEMDRRSSFGPSFSAADDGIAKQNFDAHSDSAYYQPSHDQLFEHYQPHNWERDEVGESNFDLQLQFGRPYFYHAESESRLLEGAKASANNTDFAEMSAIGASGPSSAGLKSMALLENLILRGTGAVRDEVDGPVSFPNSKSMENDVEKSTEAEGLWVEFDRRKEQYSNPMQENVPLREEQVERQESEVVSANGGESQAANAGEHCPKPAETEQQGSCYCLTCGSWFADQEHYRAHWILKHVLGRVVVSNATESGATQRASTPPRDNSTQ